MEVIMVNRIFRIIISLTLYTAIVFLCLSDVIVAHKAGSATITDTGYYKPSETLVTPHIKWLKPYSRGKIKALIIIPRTSMRDVVELAQRMDLDYSVFVTESSSLLAASKDKTPASDVMSRQTTLETALRGTYDVIIIGNCDWSLLPPNHAQSIISKVKSGVGLIGIINGPDPQIASAVPGGLSSQERSDFLGMIASFPFQQASEKSGYLIYGAKSPDTLLSTLAGIGKLGSGRVCLLSYKPKRLHAIVPGPSGDVIGRDQTGFDYQMATLIRTILWAANRVPDISVVPSAPNLGFKFEETTSRKAGFTVDNPRPPFTANTDFFIINPEGVTVLQKKGTANLATGASSLSFDIPVLPIGKYRLNLIISQSEGVINFATGILTISGSSSISSVSVDRTAFMAADRVSGKVTIANPVSGMKLMVGRYDNYDRLVDQKEYAAGVQTAFSLDPSGGNPTVINYVRAELLLADGAVIDSKRAFYSINDIRPANDDVRVVLWSRLPKEDRYYTPGVFKYWKDSGIDTLYSTFSEHIPMANMNGIPILTRFADEKTSSEFAGKVAPRAANDLIRQPCLTDPAYLTGLNKTLTDGTNLWKDYSLSEFSFGDECNFCDKEFDLCFSPTCIADFGRFLSALYPSISDLNKEYGTDYRSFDDVKPIPIDDARRTKQMALWVDHRLHMDSNWARISRQGRSTVQQIVPNAATGYEGGDTDATTWRADDYLQLTEALDFNCIYHRPFQSAVWGSRFAEENLLGLGWFGYYYQLAQKHIYATMVMPWRTIFEGANSFWIWHANPATGSVAAPDFSFYEPFGDVLSTIKELKGGLGKALIAADRQTDAGIYYSPASIHTETFLGGKINCNAGYQTAASLTRNIGFQPKVYGAQDAADGLIIKDKPKMLIMPNIQSISAAEADVIRQYVKNGGYLIADVNPGVRDSHGKLLSNGSLDDVFGVRLHGDEPLSSATPVINQTGNPIPFKPAALLCGKSIELKGGTANGTAGNIPVAIVNTFGTGRTLLLNFSIDKITGEDLKSFGSMINKMLSDSNVYPVVKIKDVIATGMQTNCFTSGGIRYVCLMPDWNGDKSSDIPEDRQMWKANLKFPGEYHAYNVRRPAYLGKIGEVNIDIKPLDPVILALVPYRILGVKLSLNSIDLRQGEQLQYTVSIATDGGAQPDPQVVRIRLTDPSGNDVSYYGANQLVKGSSMTELKLALNEKPGKWTITATDIISGLSAKTDFTVGSRQ